MGHMVEKPKTQTKEEIERELNAQDQALVNAGALRITMAVMSDDTLPDWAKIGVLYHALGVVIGNVVKLDPEHVIATIEAASAGMEDMARKTLTVRANLNAVGVKL